MTPAQAQQSVVIIDTFYTVCNEKGGFEELLERAKTAGFESASNDLSTLFFAKRLADPPQEVELVQFQPDGRAVLVYISAKPGPPLSGTMKVFCFTRGAVVDPEPGREAFRIHMVDKPSKVSDKDNYSADLWMDEEQTSARGLTIHRTKEGYSFITILQFWERV